MSAPQPCRRALALAGGLIALFGLSGCAVFGGNVKGSFSCAAPDGICAPTSSIDDRALALISGEPAAGAASPAGPYPAAAPRPQQRRIAATEPGSRSAGIEAGRTQERVLRIVFQPYVDERGRLHEASAVHAVVQRGEWQSQAIAEATPLPGPQAMAAPAPALADAVDHADAQQPVAALDPNLPDAAVVAAARARKADPVAAIKADVAAKLAARPPRLVLPPQVDAALQKVPADTVAHEGAPPAAHVPSINATVPAGQAHAEPKVEAAPPSKTRDGAEATARVKADPRYRAAVKAGQQEARQAAAGVPVRDPKPALQATVRAAGFPGAIAEDQ